MTDKPTISELSAELLEIHPPSGQLMLHLDGCLIRVQSNSQVLLSGLADYFRHVAAEGVEGRPDIEITALEARAPSFDVEFRDWPREPGKQGKKEAFANLADGRIVLKVRTGMQFLIGERIVAVGACLKNDNQIINLVNSQYMAWLLQRGYVLCHAAGIAHGGKGLGMAGSSGAGKSTLALHLISAGMSFVSNDRLLVRRSNAGVEMRGVPKMPRINPGTILGNRDLWPILEEPRRQALESMEREALWELEEKYDADVERIFGEGRVELSAPMVGFVVLTWSHKNSGPAEVERTTFAERPHLLDAVMKHPGPFVLEARPAERALEHDPASYLAHISDVPVLEISGGVDFEAASAACRELLGEHGS